MPYQVRHAFTVFRLDEHDSRRQITPEGWDAYSPPGTIARLDRLREAHTSMDHQVAALLTYLTYLTSPTLPYLLTYLHVHAWTTR